MRKTKSVIFDTLKLLSATCLAAFSGAATPSYAQELNGRAALFQEQTPIEMMASNYMNYETGYIQPKGSMLIQFGSHQSGTGMATGTQIYEGRVDWALTDRFQFSAFGQVFDDPPMCGLPGCDKNLTMLGGGATAKYSIMNSPALATSFVGSVEGLYLAGDLYNNAGDGNIDVIGSLQLPMTFRLMDEFRLHFVPGVSILPDSVNGVEYYGPIPWIGAGLTWIPSTGIQAYANVTMPFSEKGNVIAQDGEYKNIPIWNAGVRLGITPKVALDFFATNGWGMTPATSILGLTSDREDITFGMHLNYTPMLGEANRDVYFNTYRASQLIPVNLRDEQLQVDGFTLTSAATYSPKTFVIEGETNTSKSQHARLSYAPDQDVQLDAIFTKYASDGSAGIAPNPWSDKWAYMVGGKVRFLDQNYGDLISVSAQVLAGRNFEKPTTGALFVSVPISLSLTDPLTLTVNPRAGIYDDETIKGIGVGVNARVARDLQLIGEFTTVLDDGDPVWAAGVRYSMYQSPFSLDAFATNATGMAGIGTLMAQDDIQFGVNARLRF